VDSCRLGKVHPEKAYLVAALRRAVARYQIQNTRAIRRTTFPVALNELSIRVLAMHLHERLEKLMNRRIKAVQPGPLRAYSREGGLCAWP